MDKINFDEIFNSNHKEETEDLLLITYAEMPELFEGMAFPVWYKNTLNILV